MATASAMLFALHGLSLILAWRGGRARSPRPGPRPPLTVVRILCGLEASSQQTLASTFAFDYPRYDVIFSVARADDPIIPLALAEMARHPLRESRLLVGDEKVSGNPKLNNMIRPWREARFDHVVFLDSNLLAPADYLTRLASAWSDDVGVVSSAPIGSRPEGLAAELEVAWLNTHAARWQFAASALGLGFAQGKTLAFRRGSLPLAGLRRLGDEPAEDAAATKIARRSGARVAVVGPPAQQPLGARAWKDVLSRQLRWARLRRASFPALYACEAACGAWPAFVLAAAATASQNAPAIAPVLMVYALAWYGAEWAFARACGWPANITSAAAMIVRDLFLPAIWVAGWGGSAVSWRGNSVALEGASRRASGGDGEARKPMRADATAPGV